MDEHNKRKLNRNKRCGYLAGTTTCAKYQQYGIDGNVHKYCRVHYNAWKTTCNAPSEVWQIEVLFARVSTIIAIGLFVFLISTIAIGNEMFFSNQAGDYYTTTNDRLTPFHTRTAHINPPSDLNRLWPLM